MSKFNADDVALKKILDYLDDEDAEQLKPHSPKFMALSVEKKDDKPEDKLDIPAEILAELGLDTSSDDDDSKSKLDDLVSSLGK